jgi:hypothetical protein
VPVVLAVQEVIGRRIMVQGWLQEKKWTQLKNNLKGIKS